MYVLSKNIKNVKLFIFYNFKKLCILPGYVFVMLMFVCYYDVLEFKFLSKAKMSSSKH